MFSVTSVFGPEPIRNAILPAESFFKNDPNRVRFASSRREREVYAAFPLFNRPAVHHVPSLPLLNNGLNSCYHMSKHKSRGNSVPVKEFQFGNMSPMTESLAAGTSLCRDCKSCASAAEAVLIGFTYGTTKVVP